MTRPEEKERALRTRRLVLSPLAPHYASALFELLNDWDVVRMLSEVPWPLSLEDVATFLESEHTDSDDFVLVGRSGSIGVVTVKHPGGGSPPREMPRLGYWIGRKHWRQGYGAEAISALVDYAFANYPDGRVGAGVFRDNEPSRRLLEELGFSAVGRRFRFLENLGLSAVGHKLAACRSRGEKVETVEMQITRAAWEARARRR